MIYIGLLIVLLREIVLVTLSARWFRLRESSLECPKILIISKTSVKVLHPRSYLVAQKVKDPGLSLLWPEYLLCCGFNLWFGNIHMPKKEKKIHPIIPKLRGHFIFISDVIRKMHCFYNIQKLWTGLKAYLYDRYIY